MFKQARTGAPSILFIDEVDALVGNRSGEKQGGVQQRVLSTLLNEMDGVGIRLDHASYKGTKEYEEQHLQVKVITLYSVFFLQIDRVPPADTIHYTPIRGSW